MILDPDSLAALQALADATEAEVRRRQAEVTRLEVRILNRTSTMPTAPATALMV